MFHPINISQLRNFLCVGALLLALAGCGGGEPTPTAVGVASTPTPIPTPVVGEPVVSGPSTITPGEPIGISVNVDSVPGVELKYQWTHPEGQGEILDGQGTEGIIYQVPAEPGTYKMGVEITAAGAVIKRSVFITVEPMDTSTLGPTETPVTDTPTPGPSPPPDVPAITISVDGTTASGQVSGLDPAQYSAYKVLVYLKTDKWYIQPVLGGFASIQKDGSWQMTGLNIIPGVPTTPYAYLARTDFQAPDQSPQDLQVDGVDIIARAEPVEVQQGVTPTISVTSGTVIPGTASITLSVAGTTASGQVSGLDPAQYPAYKVLVYLKTNIWYIQPVLGGFASIQEDGTWRMPELKIIDGIPTMAYAYLARTDFQAPDQSPQAPQVDGVDIIAGAEPVEVQ